MSPAAPCDRMRCEHAGDGGEDGAAAMKDEGSSPSAGRKPRRALGQRQRADGMAEFVLMGSVVLVFPGGAVFAFFRSRRIRGANRMLVCMPPHRDAALPASCPQQIVARGAAPIRFAIATLAAAQARREYGLDRVCIAARPPC
jgi:hypothetical protein